MIFLDCDEINDDVIVQIRRGRPKGKTYLDKEDNKKVKSKKRNDNNKRMQQLDNPMLEPTPLKPFWFYFH